MSIFTHVCVGTDNLPAAKAFYDAALGALGIANIGPMGERAFLYGKGAPEFLVTKPANGQPATFANGGTIGFDAGSRAQVRAFHEAGLAMAAPAKVRRGRAPSRRLPMPRICATPTATSSAPTASSTASDSPPPGRGRS